MLDLKCNFPYNFLTLDITKVFIIWTSMSPLLSEHLTNMKDAATALGSRQIGI